MHFAENIFYSVITFTAVLVVLNNSGNPISFYTFH